MVYDVQNYEDKVQNKPQSKYIPVTGREGP
jgi:hypothetical protein